jgi:hypothetical protein
MLRASAEIANTDVNLHQVHGEAQQADAVEYSQELTAFATAVASRDDEELGSCRERLLTSANAEVLVDAAAVAGNFQRMVRIADSTGIPLDVSRIDMYMPSIEALELRRFRSAENTPLK